MCLVYRITAHAHVCIACASHSMRVLCTVYACACSLKGAGVLATHKYESWVLWSCRCCALRMLCEDAVH